MKKTHIFGGKHQSPVSRYSLFRGCFPVAFAPVLFLLFLGCVNESDDGGSEPRTVTAALIRIEPARQDATTTTLFLVFDRDIPGLKKEHVTISSKKTELQNITVQNIGKTGNTQGFYTLALAGIDTLEASLWPVDRFSGELSITVGADNIPGYRVASSSRPAEIHVVPPRRTVKFSRMEPGGEQNRKATTGIVLHLDPGTAGMDGLVRENVVLTGLNDANKNVMPSGDPEEIGNGVWKVPVTGVDAAGKITVTLTRNGYQFDPAFIETQVHYAEPVKLAAAANGDELMAVRTTELALTFDKPVDGLTLKDITIAENGTGAVVSSLKGSGKSYTLALKPDSVVKSGKIDVTMEKDGYEIANGPVQVAVYDAASNPEKMLAEGGTVSVIKVGDVYHELHMFTKPVNNQSLTIKNAHPITAQVLVVGGGGGGGKSGGTDWRAGGGGGGAVLIHNSYALTSSSYPVTVGAGGAAAPSTAEKVHGVNGGDSTFGPDFWAKGGGGGGSHQSGIGNSGSSGGSGGGSSGKTPTDGVAQSMVAKGGSKHGSSGASGTHDYSGGGGGGAGGMGSAPSKTYEGAQGGLGISSDITGTAIYYGGGGTGGSNVTQGTDRGAFMGNAGDENTGDGGCGGGGNRLLLTGSSGGSGVVIVRFPITSAQ
jgi:hypothetical protein